MLYQTIKHLKTKSKTVAVSKTLQEAIEAIPKPASFLELTYVGQFPIYNSVNGVYSIQGKHEQFGFVLSLSKDELAQFVKA